MVAAQFEGCLRRIFNLGPYLKVNVVKTKRLSGVRKVASAALFKGEWNTARESMPDMNQDALRVPKSTLL